MMMMMTTATIIVIVVVVVFINSENLISSFKFVKRLEAGIFLR